MNAASRLATILVATAATAFSATAAAQAASVPDADRWQWRAALYGWFPSLDARSNVTLTNGDTIGVEIGPDSYLRNLQFAFMGTLEARKGPWSIVGDVVYVDFGKANASVTALGTPAGPTSLPVPANVHADLKGFIGQVAAGYAVARSPEGRVDVIGGARYLRLETGVNAEFNVVVPGLPPQLNVARTKDFVDAIAGVRGAAELPDKWFVPYELDAGTGSSRFTWQAFAGVGYRFAWGDAMIGYRHLAYDFKDDAPVSRMSFGGPVAGVAFRF